MKPFKYDIGEWFRKYLHGELTGEEQTELERRIAGEEQLRREWNFFRLMHRGLQEMEAEGRKPAGRSFGYLLAIVVLAVGIVLFFRYCYSAGAPQSEQSTQQVSENNDGAAVEDYVTNFGGNSTAPETDRANHLALNGAGEIVVAGFFAERMKLSEAITLRSRGGVDLFAAVFTEGSECRSAWSAGGSRDFDEAQHLAIDREDHVILTGCFNDTAYFDGRPFIARGQLLREKRDFFIAKYEPSGRLLWLRHGGGDLVPDLQTGANHGSVVEVTGDNHILASGIYIGNPVFEGVQLPMGGPNEDTYLMKLDPQGKVLWADAITGPYMSGIYDLDADPQGNAYVTGYFGHHNLGGSVTLQDTMLYSYGGRDLLLAKYTPDGRLLWARQAGSPNTNGRDYGTAISVAPSGHCVVTGFFEGTARFEDRTVTGKGGRDLFLAKYDPDGVLVWLRESGVGPLDDQGDHLVQDEAGNIYLVGTFQGEAQFGSTTLQCLGGEDAFVAKYSSAGELRWVRQLGGADEAVDSDAASSVAINVQGEILISGFFTGNMIFGDQEVRSSGREDMFILKLDSDGRLIELKNVVYL